MAKTIGIIGGMGPAATIDLFKKIVISTTAQSDQDHIPILIYNNTKIPAQRQTLHALVELIHSAQILEMAGADFIIIPCNTAHIWIKDIQKTVSIPVYNMVENAVQTINRHNLSSNGNTLLLATDTTVRFELYQKSAKDTLLKIVVPSKKEQNIINKAILDVKSGNIKNNLFLEELNHIISTYEQKGITSLIGGCTEIPLLFNDIKTGMTKIDPTLLLAKLAVDKSLKTSFP